MVSPRGLEPRTVGLKVCFRLLRRPTPNYVEVLNIPLNSDTYGVLHLPATTLEDDEISSRDVPNTFRVRIDERAGCRDSRRLG